jgi:hypothetical protein
MTYIKEKHDFINVIIDHVRQKIEFLEERAEVEVEIRLSYPLRNDNPSVSFKFASPVILAEAQFWSGKTFDFVVYDNIANEVLEGSGGYFTSLDEVDGYTDKILSFYRSDTTHSGDLS